MSECYPTGCPGPEDCITFPENPSDGQKECVTIDAQGTQKCWVYDKCIPGWRAAGTSPSPVRYKGGIDLTRGARNQYPDLAAGDFFVVTNAANANTPSLYPGLDSTVNVGERVVYSGSDWQVVTPDIPYASEALGDVPLDTDGKPNPDERIGGKVKTATVSQAKAGTDKCDVITPYTLRQTLAYPDEDLLAVRWNFDDNKRKVSIINKLLNLEIIGEAFKTIDGEEVPVVGNWMWTYYYVADDGTETEFEPFVTGGINGGVAFQQSYVVDFIINPVTATRKVKAKGTFYDVNGVEYVRESPILEVSYSNGMVITTQPADINTQPTPPGDVDDKIDVKLSTTVVVQPASAELPFDASKISYTWYVYNIEIEDTNEPNLNYDFEGWNTNTLSATRTGAGAETVQLRCAIRYGTDHPEYIVTYNERGEGFITGMIDPSGRSISRQTRDHDDEVLIDYIVSDPCLLKGPTERIIKETTNEVIEREVRIVEQVPVAPRVGSVVRTIGTSSNRGTILSFDSGGNFTGSKRAYIPGGGVRVRQTRCGKCSGISDRRLKENIMPIGEYLCL